MVVAMRVKAVQAGLMKRLIRHRWQLMNMSSPHVLSRGDVAGTGSNVQCHAMLERTVFLRRACAFWTGPMQQWCRGARVLDPVNAAEPW